MSSQRPVVLGDRLNLPFTAGLMLGINAISDAALLVDGPGCIMAKARQIHGRHDLCSTVLSCVGLHRIEDTHLDVFRVATQYEPLISQRLDELTHRPGVGLLVLSSLPIGTIAGTDYQRLVDSASIPSACPLIWVPGRSMSADWLDGFASLLEGLAEHLDLTGAVPRPGAVAVVGHLMDRLEGDHRGNTAELARLLRGLDLELSSLWLSGGSVADLAAARSAAAVISLPHGRAAARILADRLAVPLVETELPFGLEGTRRWVDTVGEALDRRALAAAFCDEELDRVVPRLEWVVPQVFLDRRVVFFGDPHYCAPLALLLEEVGAQLPEAFLVGPPEHIGAAAVADLSAGRHLWFEPSQERLLQRWDALQDAGVDLLVTNGLGVERLMPAVPWVEWGFPSPHTHFLQDRPFLGFSGALSFLERCAHAIGRG